MAVNPQITGADYDAAAQEKERLAPGVSAYQAPKVTAAPKVSPPTGQPNFWQRIQADGVNMAKAVASKTTTVAKDVGNVVKDTAVSTVKEFAGAAASTANVALTHTGSGELDNAIKQRFGSSPVQGALSQTAKGSFGQKLNSFIGNPNTEQTIGNLFNTALLVGTAGAGKGIEAGGEFLLKQLGEQGVKELATKAGIDVAKTSVEDAAQQLTKAKLGAEAIKALAPHAQDFVTKALKTAGKSSALFGAFGAAQGLSEGENTKGVIKSGAEGAATGAALGGSASLLKTGVDKVTGKTTRVNDIRAKATSHQIAEKTADEKGLPAGSTTKQAQLTSGSSPKQLTSGEKTPVKGAGFTVKPEQTQTDKVVTQRISQLDKLISSAQKVGTTKSAGEMRSIMSERQSLLDVAAGKKSLSDIKTTVKDPVTIGKLIKAAENDRAPKLTSLKTSGEEKIVSKSSGLGESGSVNPGQAGKDIKDMVTKHNESTKFSSDLQKSADMVEGKKQIIKNDAKNIITGRAQLTNAEKSELQNYRDAKAAGITPKPLSSPKLVKEDADVTELNKASQKADAERARLAGKEAEAQAIETRDPSTYTHRVAQDKGSSYDYVAQGDRQSVVNRGLGKSKAGDKARVMYNLTDENGDRHTVSIKNDALKDADGRTVKRINKRVVEYTGQGKTSRSIGSLDLKTDEERMQKELAPVEKNIDNLTKEKQILSATKGRSEVSSKRLANIDEKLSQAHDDKATILNKYDTNELDGKTWKAPDGHTYTFSQATVDEIQKNSGQKYYVDPKLNAIANYADSKIALENSKFIEQIKTSDKVEDFVVKPGETAPPGFKSVPDLPQFQGYKFDPKTADVLKDIVGSKDSEANIFNRVGRFLRQTIVYFPVKHDLNMLASYSIDRGISKLASPLAYKRMVSSLYQATQDVMHQSDFFQQIQKSGFQLVSGENGELDKAFKTEIKGLLDNKDVLSKVAQQVGSTPERLVAVYNKAQQVMVWQAQDILNIARIRERMSDTVFGKGESLSDAIENTSKYNLQYKVPSRVAGSRQLAKGLKSDIVFFGTYRYDLYRTFTNILKSAVNVKDPKGAMQAWDKLVATAVGLTLVLPYVNKEIQKATGDPNAHMSAPGGFSVPSDFSELLSGKETPGAFVNQNVYLSSAYILPYQLSQNQDAFGSPIYNPYASKGTQGSQIVTWLKGQIAPLQKLSANANAPGNKIAVWVSSLSGASLPKNSPDLNKYYSLAYDQATPMYENFKGQVQSGDTKGAIAMADQYNNQLVTSLQKAWQDNNPGKTITSQEVARYIQGVYNSPWISTDKYSIASAQKPSKSILTKIK